MTDVGVTVKILGVRLMKEHAKKEEKKMNNISWACNILLSKNMSWEKKKEIYSSTVWKT